MYMNFNYVRKKNLFFLYKTTIFFNFLIKFSHYLYKKSNHGE